MGEGFDSRPKGQGRSSRRTRRCASASVEEFIAGATRLSGLHPGSSRSTPLAWPARRRRPVGRRLSVPRRAGQRRGAPRIFRRRRGARGRRGTEVAAGVSRRNARRGRRPARGTGGRGRALAAESRLGPETQERSSRRDAPAPADSGAPGAPGLYPPTCHFGVDDEDREQEVGTLGTDPRLSLFGSS